MRGTIYAFDPGARPDSDFIAGDLTRLVVGNRGRLLDARRTPILITAVIPERAAFELEISAFEDAGARWELPLEEVGRFQFAQGGAVAPSHMVAEMESAVRRFDRAFAVDADPVPAARSSRRHALDWHLSTIFPAFAVTDWSNAIQFLARRTTGQAVRSTTPIPPDPR